MAGSFFIRTFGVVKHGSIFFCLLMMLCLPVKQACAKDKHADSLVLNRVFSYRERLGGLEKCTMQVYAKHRFMTRKRNAILWLVPTMYAVARGEREFMSESYSRITYKEAGMTNAERHLEADARMQALEKENQQLKAKIKELEKKIEELRRA